MCNYACILGEIGSGWVASGWVELYGTVEISSEAEADVVAEIFWRERWTGRVGARHSQPVWHLGTKLMYNKIPAKGKSDMRKKGTVQC